MRTALAACAVVLALLAPRPAGARVVDRIVAVVGKDVITLSQLEDRSRPFRRRVADTVSDPVRRRAAEAQATREILERMVDEELERREAKRLHVEVGAEEVERAVAAVASHAALTVPEILAEARRQGMSEDDYRAELRRQILEGKLLQIVVRPTLALPPGAAEPAIVEAIEKGRRTWLGGLRRETYVDLRL